MLMAAGPGEGWPCINSAGSTGVRIRHLVSPVCTGVAGAHGQVGRAHHVQAERSRGDAKKCEALPGPLFVVNGCHQPVSPSQHVRT